MKIKATKESALEIVEHIPDERILSFRASGHQSVKDKHDGQDTQLLEELNRLSEIRAWILAHLTFCKKLQKIFRLSSREVDHSR